MRATIEYIQQRFDQYNAQFFESSLPALPIKLSNAKGFLGKICYKREPIGGLLDTLVHGRQYRNTQFVLRINTRIDLPEQEVEDTILHEMIHYYIAYHQLTDTSTHGRLFRQMMARINHEGGRHITISHRLTAEQAREAQGREKERVVCVVYFRDGKVGVKVVPRQMAHILKFHRGVGLRFPIDRLEWYTTKDGYFAKYPSSSAYKIYLVEEAELPLDHMKRLYLTCLQ